MGGTVKVTSEVGVGSTFSIIFRAMCKIPNAEDLLVPLPEVQPRRPSVNQKPIKNDNLDYDHTKRILLVNDDPFLLCAY